MKSSLSSRSDWPSGSRPTDTESMSLTTPVNGEPTRIRGLRWGWRKCLTSPYISEPLAFAFATLRLMPCEFVRNLRPSDGNLKPVKSRFQSVKSGSLIRVGTLGGNDGLETVLDCRC